MALEGQKPVLKQSQLTAKKISPPANVFKAFQVCSAALARELDAFLVPQQLLSKQIFERFFFIRKVFLRTLFRAREWVLLGCACVKIVSLLYCRVEIFR